MSTILVLVTGVFFIEYLLIIFEEKLPRIRKAPVSLIGAVILWIIVVLFKADSVPHALEVIQSDIFEIVFFLWGAMTIVEYIDKKKGFEYVRMRLYERQLNDTSQFLLICFITFCLSGILDNLTTTIVMVELAKRFFRNGNLNIAGIGIVCAANAGGAFSVIGDVPTILLWLAGKFTAKEVFLQAFLPSLTFALVSVGLLSRLVVNSNAPDSREDMPVAFPSNAKWQIPVALSCFSFPLILSQLGLPPTFGFLLAVGVVWLLNKEVKEEEEDYETHLEHDIAVLLKRVDTPALWFFVGILLSVGALEAIGLLESLSMTLLGSNPSDQRLIFVGGGMGFASAGIDNVPIVALAMNMIHTTNVWIWTLLAYTTGTGGSMMAIGSAAGIVAMSGIPTLTSIEYLKTGSLRIAIAYLAGFGVWLFQYWIFA